MSDRVGPAPLSIPPPTPVKVSAALVGVQALGIVVFAIALLVNGLSEHSATGQLLAQAAYFVVLALLLAACGLGLAKGRRWGRSPTIVLQVVWVAVGYWMAVPSGRPLIGVAIVVTAVVTGGLLVTKPANAWVEKFPLPGR